MAPKPLRRLASRPGRGRRRGATAAERLAEAARVAAEVDALVAAFADLFAPDGPPAAVYARYSTDFQHSVVDQVRACLEEAVRLGVRVAREHIYFDMGVSGRKFRRAGLDALRAALPRKPFGTLIIMATHRLSRSPYKSRQFIEEEILERDLRAVFFKSHVDTADPRWGQFFQVMSQTDEMTATMYAGHIQAAHEGMFEKGWVVASLPFGYCGVTIAGPLTKRHRPRQAIAVHAEEAEWVRTIFRWFVADRLGMSAILQRLNTADAPLPPKAYEFWSLAALRYLLENAAYRGWWSYGKGKNVWKHKADYAKKVLRDKPLREKQFEHLRLVDDETWHAAQRLLAESRWRAGRKPRDGDRKSRPRVLNGLLVCQAHGVKLKITGDKGQWMACPACRTLPKAVRPLHTYLRRDLATRRLCEAVAGLLLTDGNLADRIVAETLAAATAATAPDPARGRDLQARLDRLDRQIKFVLGNPGETDDDEKESRAQLHAYRRDRAAVQAELARLESANDAAAVPSAEEVRQAVAELAEILGAAGEAEDEATAGRLRAVLELVTGGEILVSQKGEKKRYKGWLAAAFTPRLLDGIAGRLPAGVTVVMPAGDAPAALEVDFREDNFIAEKMADVVKALVDQGLLYTEIAEREGIERHQAKAAHAIWNKKHGLPPPADGRTRRGDVPNGNIAPTKAMLLADAAKALYDRGLLLDQIAAELKIERATVRRALRIAFERLGQPMPDGRNRRKTLGIKNRPKDDRADKSGGAA